MHEKTFVYSEIFVSTNNVGERPLGAGIARFPVKNGKGAMFEPTETVRRENFLKKF